MLSRVADSIYWLTRYIERAENVARFVDVNLHLMLDLPADQDQQWDPLINITGDRELFEEFYGQATRENVMRFLTFDPDYPNSILSCIHKARESARAIRDVISSEMWVQINRFYLMMRNAAFSETFDFMAAPHDFFTHIKLSGHTFEGVMDATMSHGDAWHFGRMGRLLERADKTTRILDMKYFILLPDVTYVGSAYDNIQWAALLRSASALEMYRKHHGRIEPQNVVEFLLLDRHFPRAVRYCVRQAEESLRAITGSPPGTFRTTAERQLGRLCADLDFTTTKEILSLGLHEFVDGIQRSLNDAGTAIHDAIYARARAALDGAGADGSQTQVQVQAQT